MNAWIGCIHGWTMDHGSWIIGWNEEGGDLIHISNFCLLGIYCFVPSRCSRIVVFMPFG